MKLKSKSNTVTDIDVSVILNCHNEETYLTSTLQSLEQAILQAYKRGYKVELIFVLDNPTELTKLIAESFICKGVMRSRYYEVSFGSLGLSRNAGLLKAEGKYILTADADDLISENYIVEAMKIACCSDVDCAFFPMYLYSFGLTNGITRFFPSKYFSPCDFVAYHPFCSRIFISREKILKLLYVDSNNKSGFAFEDWDLNRRLFQLGFKLIPIPNTVLFYRQRQNSIMHVEQNHLKLPPPCELLVPDNFMSLYYAYKRPENFAMSAQFDPVSEFKNCSILRQSLIKANKIDPTIKIEAEGQRIFASLRNTDIVYPHWGYRLPLLFLLSGVSKYDTVCVLPWLEPGGGEKYILRILVQISKISKNNKILVLAVEPNNANKWRDRLPENSIFLNLWAFTTDLSEDDRLRLLVTFLLAVAENGASLHLKAGKVANQLMNQFGKSLSSHYKIYNYVFAFEWKKYFDQWIISDEMVENIRTYLPYTTAFISDNKTVPEMLSNLFGVQYKEKFKTVYAYCTAKESTIIKCNNTDQRKFLWASRVCKQKRFDLLPKIAEQLKKLGIPITIDVYGQVEDGIIIKNTSSIKYMGIFDGIDSIDLTPYSGFIYTSNFDGVPNIILEIMSKGIPVISAIGKRSAIHEVVTEATAWPVTDDINDNLLINEYCSKIQEVIENPQKAQEKALVAFNNVLTQHSQQKHFEMVKELFQLEEKGEDSSQDFQIIRQKIFAFLQVMPEKIPNSMTYTFPKPFALEKDISLKILNGLTRKKEKSLKIKKDIVTYIVTLLKPFPLIFSLARKAYRTTTVQVLLRRLR